MCMLDCLLVSATMFYMHKAKNMNGRRNIFTMNKMKSIVMLSRLFLTSFTKPEVHNVTYVSSKFLLTTFHVRQHHCIFQFTAGS